MVFLSVDEMLGSEDHREPVTVIYQTAEDGLTDDLGVRKEILQMLGGWSTSKVLDEVYIRTPQSKLVEGMKVFDDYMNALVAGCKAEQQTSENHTETQNHTNDVMKTT